MSAPDRVAPNNVVGYNLYMTQAGTNVVITGTGFEDRAKIIREHCSVGAPVRLVREPGNSHDPKAIAVYLQVPIFLGLSSAWKKIGYVKAGRNKGRSERMDNGAEVTARVGSFYAPPDMNHPRVSLLVFE